MRNTIVVSSVAVLVMAVLVVADQSRAETLRYRLSGAWEELSDGDEGAGLPGWGLNPRGASTSVPGPADTARVNWGSNVVTLDYEAPSIDRIQIGVDESGTLEVHSGGVLTTIRDVVVGNNGFVDAYLIVSDGGTVNARRDLRMGWDGEDAWGFLTIDSGGVINVERHLWLGARGKAEVNISGTLNQADGILGLGSRDFELPGGTAIVNVLDGGLMALHNVRVQDTASIQPGSKIDVSGSGRVTLPGDFIAALENYRTAGLLYGNGVAGAVDIAFETVLDGPGDFDSDGDVDGKDFLEWQQDPSVGDLAVWQANYGTLHQQTIVTAAASLSAITSVPEPGSLALMFASTFAWCGSRRWLRRCDRSESIR